MNPIKISGMFRPFKKNTMFIGVIPYSGIVNPIGKNKQPDIAVIGQMIILPQYTFDATKCYGGYDTDQILLCDAKPKDMIKVDPDEVLNL